MPQTYIEIADTEIDVDYDYKITYRGQPATGPTYSSGGEPATATEFELTIVRMRFPKQAADVPDLEIPKWLDDLLATHLSERDDIYLAIVEDDRRI